MGAFGCIQLHLERSNEVACACEDGLNRGYEAVGVALNAGYDVVQSRVRSPDASWAMRESDTRGVALNVGYEVIYIVPGAHPRTSWATRARATCT